MKILVTGGAGFIGSNLVRALNRRGHTNIVISDFLKVDFYGGKRTNLGALRYNTYVDAGELLGRLNDFGKFDVVFHLGEYARVEKSFEDMPLVWHSNKDGTFAVLEFCRKQGAKIIYAGSSTKFGLPAGSAQTGDGGLGRNQSPYAWSKASNTELVQNYGAWFNLPYAVTYFYNVYGPRELSGKFGTVIEIFRQACLRGEPLKVVAPGTQKRIFTHVDDIVRGLVMVGEKGAGDGYGLGANEEYSILEVAKMFDEKIEMLSERAGNRMNSSIDLTRSHDELGWRAKKDLVNYVKEFLASL